MNCSLSQGKGKNKRRPPLSILKDIFTDYRTQCEPFFVFSILEMLLNCLLASIIASKKSVYDMYSCSSIFKASFPSGCFLSSFFEFKLFDHDVQRRDMLCILMLLGVLGSVN